MTSALVFLGLGLGLLAAIEAAILALKVYCAYQDRRVAKARDNLMAVAEAVGVVVPDPDAIVTAPLSWELAKTPGVHAMTLIDRAAFLATARDIDGLPIYRGGRG